MELFFFCTQVEHQADSRPAVVEEQGGIVGALAKALASRSAQIQGSGKFCKWPSSNMMARFSTMLEITGTIVHNMYFENMIFPSQKFREYCYCQKTFHSIKNVTDFDLFFYQMLSLLICV